MKNVLLFALMLTVSAFAGEHKKQGSTCCMTAKADQQCSEQCKESEGHVQISVPTIQCQNCVNTVEAAAKKVDGVEFVKVDLEKKEACVHFDVKKVKKADVEKAIAASGYTANDVKRDEKAHSDLPACCQSKG